MHEETKEEYLARLKKEKDLSGSELPIEELQTNSNKLKAKLKSLFFLLLFALFFWTVLQIFGMLKSN